jgi:hypothetical protein
MTGLQEATEALSKIPHAPAAEAPPEVETPPTEETGTERPAGETPEGEQDTAIDLPASWSADYAETWKAAPPELRKIIADREAEREAGVNRKLQEAAEQRKQFETAREQAVAQAQTHVQQLQHLSQALHQQLLSEFPEVQSPADLAKLASEDPARFMQWQAKQIVLQQANQAIAAQQRQQQELQQQKIRDWAAEQDKLIVQLVPEWKDKGKRDSELQAVKAYAVDQGMPAEHAEQPIAAWALNMARKAMLYDKAKKAAPQAKVVNLPKVMKPGAAPEAGEAERTRADQALKDFRKTGSLQDAARALAARRAAQR